MAVSVPEKEFVPRDAEGPPDEQSRTAAAPLPPEDEDDRVLARQARTIRRIQGSPRVQQGQEYHEWLADLALHMKGTKYHDIGSAPKRPKEPTLTRATVSAEESASRPEPEASRPPSAGLRINTPKIPDMKLSEPRWSYWVDVDADVDNESQTSFSLADWMKDTAEGVEANLGDEDEGLRSSPSWNWSEPTGVAKTGQSADHPELGAERRASFSVSDWMHEIADKGDEVIFNPYEAEAPETASPDFKWDELDDLEEIDESSLSFETYEPNSDDDDDKFESFWDALEAQSEETLRSAANAPKRTDVRIDLMVAKPDYDLNQPELFADEDPQLQEEIEEEQEPSETIVGYTTNEDGEIRYWTAHDWFVLQKWRAIISANGNGVFGDDGSMIHQVWSKLGPLFSIVAMWAALTNFIRKVVVFWGPKNS